MLRHRLTLSRSTALLLLGVASCARVEPVGQGREAGSFQPDGSMDVGCPPPPTPHVSVDESGRFALEGQTLLPRGINSYPLLEHAGRGELRAMHDILTQAKLLDRPLIRTNAFIDGGDHPARTRNDDGSLHEQGLQALDVVLAAAAEHGVRLILTLTNNWTDYGGAEAVLRAVAPKQKLHKNAFWSDPRAIEAQLAYQRALVTRMNGVNGRAYADDPAIFAWELANEARCDPAVTPKLCDTDTLVRWSARMAGGLRAAGARQLIAWGGSGYLGQYGEDLEQIAARGGVDVLTFHMYASVVHSSGPEAALSWGDAALRRRVLVAERAGKPLLLEEANWKPEAERERDTERARVLGSWLETAHALSVGTLPWMIGEQQRRDYDGYLITQDDPATLEAVACR